MIAAALLGLAVTAGGHDFPVFVWCQDHADRALPKALVEPFGGVNLEGSADGEWARANELDFYVGHAPGREELHLDRAVTWYDSMWKEFYETRDASQLVRQPCLTDPKTLRRCLDRLDRSLRARDGELGHAVSLGDEVGLTPWGDPLDLCQGPHCTRRWNEWRAERGLEPSVWPTTDAVRLAYADGETDRVHDWLERRRFHQQVVLEFLTRLARHARQERSEARVALFGLTGQTAFGGVSIPRILPRLQVIEAYSEGIARELLYTLRTDQDSWCTVFPAGGDSDRGAHRIWEHWLRGGNGAILWSDRELKKNPSYLDSLARAVGGVREVSARFPSWRPQTTGVAVIHDPDSTALAWLRDALSDGPTWPRRFAGYQTEHGTRERALRDTVRLLEDCGALPGALPLASVGAASVERFGVLVAVHQLVLSSSGEAKLAAFLEAGGTLILRGPLGLLGERGSQRSRQAEQRLRERFPRRVLRLESDVPELVPYDSLRLENRDARARALREELLEALSRDRREPLPRKSALSVETNPPFPLLRAEQELPDGSRLHAALPNVPVGTIPELRLSLESECELELVFPPVEDWKTGEPIRLAPGQALVVRARAR